MHLAVCIQMFVVCRQGTWRCCVLLNQAGATVYKQASAVICFHRPHTSRMSSAYGGYQSLFEGTAHMPNVLSSLPMHGHQEQQQKPSAVCLHVS